MRFLFLIESFGVKKGRGPFWCPESKFMIFWFFSSCDLIFDIKFPRFSASHINRCRSTDAQICLLDGFRQEIVCVNLKCGHKFLHNMAMKEQKGQPCPRQEQLSISCEEIQNYSKHETHFVVPREKA